MLKASKGEAEHLLLGSVVIVQDPIVPGPVINGAINITRVAQGGHMAQSADEELSMPMESNIQTLQAVIGGVSSDPLLAIASVSPHVQKLTVSCRWEHGRAAQLKVVLKPEHTLLLKACSAVPHPDALEDLPLSGGHDGAISIRIRSDRSLDDFTAFALRAPDGSDSFSGTTFNFLNDTLAQHQAYVGIPFGQTYEPKGLFALRVAVANYAATSASASVDLYSTVSGLNDHKHLADINVRPDSVREIELKAPSSDSHSHNTILVTTRSPHSSIATSLLAVDRDKHTWLPVLAKNQEDLENGGMHPWTSSSATSQLALWNYTGERAPVWINLSTSEHKWMKRVTLNAFETYILNINEVVSKQAKDDSNRVLPPNTTQGQISWAAFGHAKGRLVEIAANGVTNHSYSCGTAVEPCGSGTMRPSPVNVSVGGTANVGALINYCLVQLSCQGSAYGIDKVQSIETWSSSNTSIATIIPNGSFSATLHGVANGSVSLVDEARSEPGDPLAYLNCNGSAVGLATVTTSGCPNTIYVTQITQGNLANDFPTDHTGVGILTLMTVAPSTNNYDGITLFETVTPQTNTCPTSIKSAASFPTITLASQSSFVVDQPPISSWEGGSYPAVHNAFYDAHTSKSVGNLLAGSGVTSCSATAQQVYYCNNTAIASFTLTNTYTASTINGTSVTIVTTTKQ